VLYLIGQKADGKCPLAPLSPLSHDVDDDVAPLGLGVDDLHELRQLGVRGDAHRPLLADDDRREG
jgi:hypothetical protein